MADRFRAYGLAAAVFAFDRLTKIAVERTISFTDTVRVIPGLFDIVHSENRGVAFGILNDSTAAWRGLALVVISVVAVVAIAIALWNPQRFTRASFWAFSLILGGAAGNLFDRAVSGQVTDFLRFYLGNHEWPTFNIADSAIVIGCGLMLLDQFRSKKQVANVS